MRQTAGCGFSSPAEKATSNRLLLGQSVIDGKVDPDGTNPPSNPTLISPQKSTEIHIGQGDSGGDSINVPAYSYVVVEYTS
eukprot:SAG31_NODE_307_length_17957_cov_5.236645_6_plen_81_part_00